MLRRNCLIIFILHLLCLQLSAQVEHPVTGDKYPWTALPEINPRNFKFIILPDRTGGELPGIFDNTGDNLNNENPDFFITIGDMVDGYTQNIEYLKSMWTNYEQSVSKLNAPVFYTVGNHDMSNEMMADFWKEKFGPSYYHFVIGDNLFLVLNTEEGGKAGISESQSDYFLNVIGQKAEGKKIFVFMHRPFWMEENMMGYEKLDKILQKYNDNTILFCGHEHRYMKIEKNAIPHYMVATLGGGSDLRGVSLGEFNHYMVVEVDETDIKVRNILANGEEIPDDVVNNSNIAEVNALSAGTWLKIPPTVAEKQKNKELTMFMIISNPMNRALQVKGKLPEDEIYSFAEKNIDRTIEANSIDSIYVALYGKEGDLDLFGMQKIDIELEGTYVVDGKGVFAKAKVPYVLDYIRICTPETSLIECKWPGYIKEDWDWKGVDDGYFTFRIKYKDNNIYLDIRTEDDKLILADDPHAMQDKLYIQFSDDTSNRKQYAYFMLTANGEIIDLTNSVYTISGTCKSVGNSLEASVKIPIAEQSNMFRLNIGFMDHDNPLNTKPSVLWWKPVWDSAYDYPESGTFRLIK